MVWHDAHQLDVRARTEPSASSSRAETTIVFGTSLNDVRTGWPGSAPSHSSVAAFGARTASRVSRSVHPECRSNAVSSSVARRGSPPAPGRVPDLFAPRTRDSTTSTDTDLETLDDLVLGSSRSSLGADERKRKSLFGSSEYLELVDIDLRDEKPGSGGQGGGRLPRVPPPAYLDLDAQMEPERYEYEAV